MARRPTRQRAAGDLEQNLAEARSAWPDIELDPATFLDHVRSRGSGSGEDGEPWRALHLSDLYLACACGHGDPRALAEFERHHLSRVGAFVARTDSSPAFADEVKQHLRDQLFVSRGGAPPKILTYSGQGALGGWLRTVAVREALARRASGDREVALDGAGRDLRAPGVDPELDYLKTRYADEVRQAFETTLASLSSRQATVLRLHFLEGMTYEALATLYKVHRQTAARWVEDSREKILKEIRRLLRQKLRLAPSEVESLMALVQSRLDLSISRLLARSEG